MGPQKIPEVEVTKHERLTISIWLVPVVALLISLWLAYQYFSELGPEITIEFKSSAGLKAKQSQVRFRNVPIGTVKKITLKEGGESVIVTARINKDAEQFLNYNAKFWVVRPKIDKSGITGLETLVSGSYIELHSALGTDFKDEFEGLEEPFLDDENIEGKYFKLSAPSSYDLEQGSIVFCRNIEVGEIKQVKLAAHGDFVQFDIFVKDPYHHFINAQTQFWNMSNFRLDMNQARLDISLASSSQILYGGISFNTPGKSLNHYPLEKEHVFPLFANKGEARAKRIGFNQGDIHTFQMHFDQNVGKLDIGAPVRFQNFQIGSVINTESSFDNDRNKINTKVLVDIDLSTFENEHNRSTSYLSSALQKGLIAQLAQTNPLLDSLFIELVYDKNQSRQKIISANPYDIFPTRSVTFENISAKIETLITSMTTLVEGSTLPIQQILKNINKTLQNINALTSSNGLKSLPKQINTTLSELQNTLKSAQTLISTESKMSDDISASMKEVNKASKTLERVLRKIDQKPNALLFGDD
ncbi:MAG: MlaD family protein [Epsilonproteobacteria bacterium]|nr:MlaD family protein [Campylobacterota bacterium]